MARNQATEVKLSKKQEKILKQLQVGSHSPFHFKQRAEIIIMASQGKSNNEIERSTKLNGETITKWRNRYAAAYQELSLTERENPHKLRALIKKTLSDQSRNGRPPTFTDIQIACIITLSLLKPEEVKIPFSDLMYPFSHWTLSLLREAVIAQKMVSSISITQIFRYLKKRNLKPHQVKSWLNPKIEDMELFSEKTKEICDIYINASEMEQDGILVYSTDEKMGVQAREHKNPSIPMKEGYAEKIDPEYIRHGTSGIIASRNITTGEIVAPMVQPTRTEIDFGIHIRDVIKVNPRNYHIFLLDNLNIHKSVTLVRIVAEIEGIPESELGIKERKGILKSMASREKFLSDPSHRVRFVYTPLHCSWLNQIECWFGIITRRLLNRRASFLSVSNLEQRIMEFINYYNEFLKKPFKWNYKGKLLIV